MVCGMKRAYVFGPIHLFGKNYLPIYKKLMKVCEPFFGQVLGTYPDFWNSKEKPKAFYNRTVKTISNCDWFIAEVSSPSHGVGMELQLAAEKNIPVIALAKQGAKLSSMVLGLPNLHSVIRYSNTADLLKKLEKKLVSLQM